METSPFQYFILFPSLPAELRLEIWRHSCHERVVDVTYIAEMDKCLTTAPPPSVLHTCRESRAEALRLYSPFFGTKSHPSTIFFNPGSDVLYLPRPPLMGYDDSFRTLAELVPTAMSVIHLAIDYIDPADQKPWEVYNTYVLLQSLPNVGEALLILNNGAEAKVDNTCRGLQLRDPAGTLPALSQLLSRVEKSFAYELGLGSGLQSIRGESPEPIAMPSLTLKSMTVAA
jgi:hypothetical protein